MNLKRIRWGVRGVLMLGVAASVTANVLHAVDNPISQSIAAWPPLALLLTVELISRIPVHSRALAAARVVATAVIAGIAAWVSYWHMAGVAARYGETGASPYLLPISVDGLIVVASICLFELAGRIRGAEGVAAPAAEPVLTRSVIRFDHERPIGPMPAARARTPRVQPRSLTAAERVTAAHSKNPAATHERLAKVANVSVSTVKRYRPTGSPSGPLPAQTRINGTVPDLEAVTH
jgi:Protein of unknown function (DUF2637)